MLGQRGDGEGRINSQVGADHRSIHNVETVVAEDAAGRVDDPVFRAAADTAAAEDVGGGGGVEEDLVVRRLWNAVKFVGDLARDFVGDRDV